MNAEYRSKRLAQMQQTCRHFIGIQHRTCRAGVDMKSMRDVSQPGPACWPCLPGIDGKRSSFTCVHLSLPTAEEAEADMRAIEEATDAFLKKMALGVCQCGVEGTDWKQVGSCIYAEPCGHRIAQGNAAEYKAGVLKARAEPVTP